MLIAVGVMSTMDGRPHDWGPLNTHGPQRHPESSYDPRCLKGAVGHQSVETDGDSEPGQHPATDQHGNVGPSHPAELPRRCDRDDQPDEREDNGRNHGQLLVEGRFQHLFRSW